MDEMLDSAFSRRDMLRLLTVIGAGAGAATVPGLLEACGVNSTSSATPAPNPSALAGTTVRAMMAGAPQTDVLLGLLPDFEKRTGIKYQLDQLGFPIVQQRAELELSTGGTTYDIIQMVMIQIGRVTGAGWATDLMPFVKRDKFDLSDFEAGAINLFKKGDGLYALPWTPDTQMVTYRKDVYDKAGLTPPTTFDELMTQAAKLASKDRPFFVCENNWHWIWPAFLQSYGGGYFAKPPSDLHPTFNNDVAIKTAGMLVDLSTKYGLPNAANVDIPGSQAVMQQGKAAFQLGGLGVLSAALDKNKSTVADVIGFSPLPKGPSGWFPQLAMHGYMIPAKAQHKDAAWEVIKWATSRQIGVAQVNQQHFLAQSRRSVLTDPSMKQFGNVNGTDVGKLQADAMTRAGSGYMAYRLVPPFRQVGDRINIAFGQMVSGQSRVKDALDSLQRDATGILSQGGYI